jgi:nucleotide-binding universal stress UspA family protein
MLHKVVRRILAPVDLSGRAPPDMDYAVNLAAQLGAELILLAVIDSSTTVGLIGSHRAAAQSAPGFQSGLVEDVKRILQPIVDQATALGVKALGHATVSEEVEEQILKEALLQRVDLILVRSKGHIGLMKALLGSTAGDILKAAPCPVLVARA